MANKRKHYNMDNCQPAISLGGGASFTTYRIVNGYAVFFHNDMRDSDWGEYSITFDETPLKGFDVKDRKKGIVRVWKLSEHFDQIQAWQIGMVLRECVRREGHDLMNVMLVDGNDVSQMEYASAAGMMIFWNTLPDEYPQGVVVGGDRMLMTGSTEEQAMKAFEPPPPGYFNEGGDDDD